MRQLHALIIGTSLALPSLALAAPPEQSQRPVAATASQSVAPQAAATGEREQARHADRARYAEKEAQAGDAQDYRGGDTVVIGASAATAILAVLLLIVLL